MSRVEATHGIARTDDLPVVASSEGLGGRWVSFKFQTADEFVAADLTLVNVGTPVQTAAIVFDMGNNIVGRNIGNWHSVNPAHLRRTGVTVAATEPVSGEGVEVSATHDDDCGFQDRHCWFRVHFSLNNPDATGANAAPRYGVYRALLWVASPMAESYQWEFRTRKGELLGVQEGPETFMYTSSHFRGTLVAEGDAAGVGANTAVDAHLPLTIGNTLFGWYSGNWTGVETISVTTPEGNDQVCSCLWDRAGGEGAAGPGEYVFHATSAAVGMQGFDDIVLGGADAHLPR